MAAPTTVARQLPPGFKMPDGFKTLLTLANKPALQIWEETVKPPGIDGGDAIETTTMQNIAFRTKDARKLKTLEPVTGTAAIDPDVYADLLTQVNTPQSITVTFPEGSTIAFWGYLQKMEAPDHKEGEMPKYSYTIIVTNWDPAAFVEAGPVFTPAPGT